MTAAETVLATLLDRYALAVRAKDLAAFTRLYADEVVVFDPFDSWTISGLANWRASTAVWFAALGEQPIAVTHSQVRAQRHGDLLAGHRRDEHVVLEAHEPGSRAFARAEIACGEQRHREGRGAEQHEKERR